MVTNCRDPFGVAACDVSVPAVTGPPPPPPPPAPPPAPPFPPAPPLHWSVPLMSAYPVQKMRKPLVSRVRVDSMVRFVKDASRVRALLVIGPEGRVPEGPTPAPPKPPPPRLNPPSRSGRNGRG